MVVITDANDVVKQVALIPGIPVTRLPEGHHCYFPVTEEIPSVGTVFKPNLETQPWLAEA